MRISDWSSDVCSSDLPVIIREAIQRERFRGGQIFYVCPRISDLDRVRNRITNLAPEAKIAVAHGQMATKDLEADTTAFCDGRYDVLISHYISEARLHLPTSTPVASHRTHTLGPVPLTHTIR